MGIYRHVDPNLIKRGDSGTFLHSLWVCRGGSSESLQQHVSSSRCQKRKAAPVLELVPARGCGDHPLRGHWLPAQGGGESLRCDTGTKFLGGEQSCCDSYLNRASTSSEAPR